MDSVDDKSNVKLPSTDSVEFYATRLILRVEDDVFPALCHPAVINFILTRMNQLGFCLLYNITGQVDIYILCNCVHMLVYIYMHIYPCV
jgi:hypothetical protein